jgi:hypothetical protein
MFGGMFIFRGRGGGLVPNPHEKRGMCIMQIVHVDCTNGIRYQQDSLRNEERCDKGTLHLQSCETA